MEIYFAIKKLTNFYLRLGATKGIILFKGFFMTGKTLTRADLANMIVNTVGLSRSESADIVETVLSEVSDALVDGSSVKLSSFGSFTLRNKRARMGRNPKTGEEVPITPRRVLSFRPSHVMKDKINKRP